MLRIITWNVNSVRTRLEHLKLLLRQENPSCVLLQETKCEDKDFPFQEIQDLGYNVKTFGQKSYNGVAILSKERIEDVKMGLSGDDARYIESVTYFNGKAFKLASVYVPNGNPNGEEAKRNIKPSTSERFKYKLQFLDALGKRMDEEHNQSECFIVGGDINIAPEDVDVYSVRNWEGKVCFLPEEKLKFKEILDSKYKDAVRHMAGEKQVFSWYDYKTNGFNAGRGLRIDHFFVPSILEDKLKSYAILEHYRGLERPSDHVPIQIELIL